MQKLSTVSNRSNNKDEINSGNEDHKQGEFVDYEVHASEGMPFERTSNNGGNEGLRVRRATTEQGEAVVNTHQSLTDRAVFNLQPLFIFGIKDYYNFILPFLKVSDIQALRSTCKVLYYAISSPILRYNLSDEGASLEDLARQGEKFKVISLIVGEDCRLDRKFLDKNKEPRLKRRGIKRAEAADFHAICGILHPDFSRN